MVKNIDARAARRAELSGSVGQAVGVDQFNMSITIPCLPHARAARERFDVLYELCAYGDVTLPKKNAPVPIADARDIFCLLPIYVVISTKRLLSSLSLHS